MQHIGCEYAEAEYLHGFPRQWLVPEGCIQIDACKMCSDCFFRMHCPSHFLPLRRTGLHMKHVHRWNLKSYMFRGTLFFRRSDLDRLVEAGKLIKNDTE